jgi:hypothetical protein
MQIMIMGRFGRYLPALAHDHETAPTRLATIEATLQL